jgi:hypothetical protein
VETGYCGNILIVYTVMRGEDLQHTICSATAYWKTGYRQTTPCGQIRAMVDDALKGFDLRPIHCEVLIDRSLLLRLSDNLI